MVPSVTFNVRVADPRNTVKARTSPGLCWLRTCARSIRLELFAVNCGDDIFDLQAGLICAGFRTHLGNHHTCGLLDAKPGSDCRAGRGIAHSQIGMLYLAAGHELVGDQLESLVRPSPRRVC